MAGFFLLAEFFLDSITAVVFLTTGHRRLPDVALQPHSHPGLLVGAIFSSAVMGALLIGFFVYGPKAIGGGIDEVIGAILGIGVAFAWWTRRRAAPPVVFAGADVSDAVGDAVSADVSAAVGNPVGTDAHAGTPETTKPLAL